MLSSFEEKNEKNLDAVIYRLYKNMFDRLTREEDLRHACAIYEYENNGVVPECENAQSNALPSL